LSVWPYRGAFGSGLRRVEAVLGLLGYLFSVDPAVYGATADSYSVTACLVRAHSFLEERMDQYHNVFYVYNPFLDMTIPRIREIRRGETGPTLMWTSSGGETCTVQRCDRLDGGWSAGTPVVTGQWETQWTDPDGTRSCGFYRLAMSF